MHEQLDGLAAEARAAAEAVATGGQPLGNARTVGWSTVAKESPLPEVPDGQVADITVVDLVVDRCPPSSTGCGPRVDRLGDLGPGHPGSADRSSGRVGEAAVDVSAQQR